MSNKASDLLKAAGLTGETGGISINRLVSPAGSSAQSGGIGPIIQQATQQIQQLQTVTQQNIDTVSANTDALDSGSASHSAASTLSSLLPSSDGLLGGITSGVSSLGGGLAGLGGLGGIFSLFSGIAGLFGGGPKQPTPLTPYVAPDPVNFEESDSNGSVGDAVYNSLGQPRSSSFTELALNGLNAPPPASSQASANPSTAAPPSSGQQITVNVQAMDSQSFMDRSQDIANAVRSAMLNMHSINDVIGDL